ncbi:restriction endonuclease [Pseudobacillus sp. FSL P4-0506]|uniref:restriction endonuclease n=1 Tax=Pseudobacillus sp. FSL P4-0506 TaxID=2921576 RepID=UPI0030F652D5
MLLIEVIAGIILIVAFLHFHITKRKNTYQTALIAHQMDMSKQIKQTLAMGLYLRFKKEHKDQPENYSAAFIREDPLAFELFVAEAIEKTRGGTTWVSPPNGDFGVDFEHTIKEGLFLGQVKCCKEDIGYEAIAILHSNMIKQGAKGGYVINIGSFTKAAKEYADGISIELIDGMKLVEMWLESTEQEVKAVIPTYV